MVHKDISSRTLAIFQRLYEKHFPIAKIKLINDYNGSDDDSMDDNNSSAFNCRGIYGSDGSTFSIHSYGLAIDINPIQNPYLSIAKSEGNLIKCFPTLGKGFINRANIRDGMVETVIDEEAKLTVVDIFEKNEFEWGGRWNDRIDWQHFQIPRDKAEKIVESNSILTANEVVAEVLCSHGNYTLPLEYLNNNIEACSFIENAESF